MSMRSILIAGVLASIILFLVSAGVHAVTRDDYRRTLNSASADLQSALDMEKRSAGSGQKVLDGLHGRLPNSVDVTDGGSTVKTDLSWLRDEVKRLKGLKGSGRSEGISGLIERTRVYERSMESGDRQLSADKARAGLDAVLSHKKYQSVKKPESWFNRLLKRVGRALADAFSGAFSRTSVEALEVGAWILLGIFALLIAVALVYLALFLVDRYSIRVPQERLPTKERSFITRPTLESLIANAEKEALDGRYRDAFRSIYLAAILLLDREGLITYTDSGTNWEYLRALRGRNADPHAAVFREMTGVFDEMVYGHREASRSEYLDGMRRYRELEASV